MYCPRCGQQQVTDDTRFCSKCGFLLTGTAQVIANNGELPFNLPPTHLKRNSPRRRGVKQGALILFAGLFLIVPIIGLLSEIIGFNDRFIGIAAVLTIFGGILRMVYALMFEDSTTTFIREGAFNPAPSFSSPETPFALPSQQSEPIPVDIKSGRWRDTNQLATPNSVAEHTTKLLERDE